MRLPLFIKGRVGERYIIVETNEGTGQLTERRGTMMV